MPTLMWPPEPSTCRVIDRVKSKALETTDVAVTETVCPDTQSITPESERHCTVTLGNTGRHRVPVHRMQRSNCGSHLSIACDDGGIVPTTKAQIQVNDRGAVHLHAHCGDLSGACRAFPVTQHSEPVTPETATDSASSHARAPGPCLPPAGFVAITGAC